MTLHETPPPPHGPPADICRLHDGGQELRELLQGADVLHLVDLVPADLPLVDELAQRHPAPRFVFHWTGLAPERGQQLSRLAQQTGAPLLSQHPGLAQATFLPPWIHHGRPPWVPLLPGTRARARTGTLTLFASSPDPLSARPGLEALVESAERLHLEAHGGERQARVEVVVDTFVRAIAQRRRRAHLTLADAEGAMLLEALESLLQGIPAVARLDPQVRAAYEALADAPAPIFEPDALPQLVAELDPRVDPLASCIAWCRQATAPERWLDACRRLYAVASPVPWVA